jgi:hypothetical protein
MAIVLLFNLASLRVAEGAPECHRYVALVSVIDDPLNTDALHRVSPHLPVTPAKTLAVLTKAESWIINTAKN